MAKQTTKERNYKIQVVNIKLLSDSRSGYDAYSDIVSKIYKDKVSIPVRGDSHMILRTQYSDIVRMNNMDIKVFYGEISQYTVIDGNEWLNMDSMEVENFELQANMFPNLKETRYIFIPAAHRFAIVCSHTINANKVARFMSDAMEKVIAGSEDCVVVVEQSEDVFERILNAGIIKKLLVDISYSNADAGDAAFEWMDSQIRESDMKRLIIEASPNQTGSIKTDSTLVSGALRVAQSNGYAQATIVENNKTLKIDTKEHPRTILITSEDVTLRARIVERIMSIFRSHANNRQ